MKGIVEERAAMLGEYIIESKATVRSTAKKFGVSKSTVHKDVSQRLKKLNPSLYKQVREILDTNKSERHIRGGMATKEKQQIAMESVENYLVDHENMLIKLLTPPFCNTELALAQVYCTYTLVSPSKFKTLS